MRHMLGAALTRHAAVGNMKVCHYYYSYAWMSTILLKYRFKLAWQLWRGAYSSRRRRRLS